MSSEANQKKIDNKVKATVGPPLLPIKALHKTPPLTNIRGSGSPVLSPPLPLDPRLAWIRLRN